MGGTTKAGHKVEQEATRQIRRMWGDLEVTDAKANLRVFVSPEDIAGATEKDPAYCVFARACRRTFHATKVLFFRSVAYVELPDEKGVRHVERFLMPASMRALVESFDRGEGIPPEGGFLLQAPRPSKRIDSETRRRATRRLAERRRLEGRVESVAGTGRPVPFGDGPIVVDLSVRSGVGAVRFLSKR